MARTTMIEILEGSQAGQTIVLQFEGQDAATEEEVNLISQAMPARENPIVDWASGGQEKFRFRAVWRAGLGLGMDYLEPDIFDIIDRMRSLREVDPLLGRPPVCAVYFGLRQMIIGYLKSKPIGVLGQDDMEMIDHLEMDLEFWRTEVPEREGGSANQPPGL